MPLNMRDIIALEGCNDGLKRIRELYTILAIELGKNYKNIEKIYQIIDDVVEIAVPILETLRKTSYNDIDIERAWALTKDILLYAGKDPTTSALKKNIGIKNFKGALERVRILSKQVYGAQKIVLSKLLKKNYNIPVTV